MVPDRVFPTSPTAPALVRWAAGSLVTGILLLSGTAQAASQSRYAGSCAAVTGAWSNVGNATGAPDATSATIAFPPAAADLTLQCTNFGFTIPGGSTIDGVQITLRESSSVANTDFGIVLVNVGSIGGAFWGTSLTDETYGDSTQLWGFGSWTTAVVNQTSFGAQANVNHVVPPAASSTAAIDSMRITVFFTPPAPVPALGWPARALLMGGLALLGSLMVKRRRAALR